MKIYDVSDKKFAKYGKVLDGYEFDELFDNLKQTEVPKSGIEYVASNDSLENCAVADEFEKRGFGGMKIQIGYVNGVNTTLNCLEYHKSSEFNIAMNDVVLVLGNESAIADGKFDTNLCEVFFIPAGSGVELYGTTLHYAPFSIDENGYRVVCVLPRGTNDGKINFDCRNYEDKACFGVNKWLLAHGDAPEVSDGAYVGLKGKNIKYTDLEEK